MNGSKTESWTCRLSPMKKPVTTAVSSSMEGPVERVLNLLAAAALWALKTPYLRGSSRSLCCERMVARS